MKRQSKIRLSAKFLFGKSSGKLLLFLLLLIGFQCFAQGNSAKHYAWTGKIGQNIPVSVWIEMRPDGLVAGEIIYTKSGNGKPILLLGNYTEKSNELFLTEYQPDGFQSGFIEGKITADNIFSGNWKVNKEGLVFKEYEMTLDSVISFPKDIKSLLQPATTEDIGGVYSFRFLHGGGSQPYGIVTVNRNDDEVRFDVYTRWFDERECSNEKDDKPAKLDGNEFSYVMKDCKIRSFECEFFEKFVYIRDLEDDASGCANFSYSIEGFYAKNQQNNN